MPVRSATPPSYEMLRGLVVVRIVVITTLKFSALLIQYAFDVALQVDPLYFSTIVGFALSILSAATLKRMRPESHGVLQIFGDLCLVTLIVNITGGPATIFTFLYLAVVVCGAALFGRTGGLVVAALAAIFYGVLVYLYGTGIIQATLHQGIVAPVIAGPALVQNVLLNTSAFFATALLVASSSESLRSAREDAVKRSAEMAELQALHSAVLSSMSSGVLTTDLSGTVTFANRASYELLQVPTPDLVGRSVVSIGLVDEPSWRSVTDSGSQVLRFEGHRPQFGPDAYIGVSATPLFDSFGRTIGRIFIFQNLTDLKRLEGEVRLKDKMAAVGELAAAIAHEIRNPLASISGSVQVLKSSSGLGAEDVRLMEIVVAESSRLSIILEDFLRYVKPREREVTWLDGASALEDVMTLFGHSQELAPSHRLVLEIPAGTVRIQGDAGQLRQIFWNLSRNAIAAMPRGGTLNVTSAVRTDSWTVTFRDTGRGMTPEERDRLFTPFAHSFPGGTGLGLAIVYRIVEEHGGTIRVETEPSKGTAITIELPRSDEHASGGPLVR